MTLLLPAFGLDKDGLVLIIRVMGVDVFQGKGVVEYSSGNARASYTDR